MLFRSGTILSCVIDNYKEVAPNGLLHPREFCKAAPITRLEELLADRRLTFDAQGLFTADQWRTEVLRETTELGIHAWRNEQASAFLARRDLKQN